MKEERKTKLLAILAKAGDQYVSGEEMADILLCSRAAIWKNIAELRNAGYPIEASTRLGYRFSVPDRLLEKEVTEALFTTPSGLPFTVHVRAATPSTNLWAKEEAERGAPEFSVYSTIVQTAGKGRRGRSFASANADGLWVSILLRPALPPRDFSSIPLLIGLAVARVLRRDAGVDVGLKWPNDIISRLNGRKLCGILSETSMEENRISYCVIGLGVNLTQKEFPEDLSAIATSVALENGSVGKAELLVGILRELSDLYPPFLSNPAGFLAEYRDLCDTLSRRVSIHSDIVREGVATDVTASGDLMVRADDGTLYVCTSGEVSVRGMLGYDGSL